MLSSVAVRGCPDGDAEFWSAHGTSTDPFEEGRKYRKTTFPSARGLWRISQRLIELGLSVTSHAAVVARGMGKPCVTGAGALRVDYRAQTMTAGGTTMKKGDTLTIDGSTGQVLPARCRCASPSLPAPPPRPRWAVALVRKRKRFVLPLVPTHAGTQQFEP